jgi:hypothetical protein
MSYNKTPFRLLPAANEFTFKGTKVTRIPFQTNPPRPLSEQELMNPAMASQSEVRRLFSSQYNLNKSGI